MANQETVSAVPPAGDDHPTGYQDLIARAREAEARYDHETAVAAYNTALDLPDLTLEEKYEILDGRSTAYYNWGIPDQIAIGAKSLVALARKTGDKQRLAEAMAVHGFYWRNQGTDKPSLELEQEALHLADKQNDDRLRGYCRLTLAIHAWNDGDPDLAQEHLDKGLAAARRSGADDILFNAVRLHAVANQAFGRKDVALHFLTEMLSLAHKSGSELHRYQTLLLYGNTATDLAARRDYYEQAYHAETAANYRNGGSTGNMAGLFWKLGLYGRALDYATSSLQRAEVSGLAYRIGTASDTLGKILLARGLVDEAEQQFKKGSTAAEGAFSEKAPNVIGLAEIALARGQLSEAADHFQFARKLFKLIEPVALAGLGVTYLAMGKNEQALAYSSKSVAFLEEGHADEDYHEQEIWWRHYQVLKAARREDPFAALDKARQTMLAGIETLSDEGLRRNYLNEVAVNRDITLTWTAEAAKRGIPLDPFTKHEPLAGNLRAQFRRVVDIGTRLTAQHDPETLARFIVDEFVEMSGAERVLLIRDEESEPAVIAAHNAGEVAELAAPLLEKIRHSRQPVLEQDTGDVPPGEAPELHQRSLIALPLVASDRFLGLLYGDMRQIFGRFNEADIQLLGLLANQAAAALENADLVSTLEDRVVERTTELAKQVEETQQRNAELAVINAVQEGLVAELDLQGIYDLVGDKLVEVFNAEYVSISLHDVDSETVTLVYAMDNVERLSMGTYPYNSIGRFLAREKKTLYLRTSDELKTFFAENDDRIKFGTPSHSSLFVPLIVGDEITASISLQDGQPNAYSDEDVRLITTLANSMSIALENAQLFNDAREAKAEAEVAREAAEISRQVAEDANEAKSAFMSNMSHELRTPLNAIIGFTRIVQRKTKGQIPERQTDNLDKVLNSGEHLLGLINTVLDIAKIEAGRMDVISSRFHIGHVIEAVSTISQPLVKPSVNLHIEIAPGLPELNSDQDKIKQILLNLLSNAAKFTHEGSITVAAYENGDTLRIDVTDTGIGMSEDALSRVFEEFQQADAMTRKEYGGTGLGMPISKHLAQLLDGDLTVVSNEGEGSMFTLTLPIKGDSS